MDSYNGCKNSDVKKSKKFSQITSKLNCAAGQPSCDNTMYMKTESTDNSEQNHNCYKNTSGRLHHENMKDSCNEKHIQNNISKNGDLKNCSKTNGYMPPFINGDKILNEYVNKNELCCRNFIENIVSSEFVDKFEPSHQLGPDYIIPTEATYTSKRDGAVKLRSSDSGPASRQPISLVTYLRLTVLRSPTRNALSVKRNGKWIHWTWADYQRDIHTVAKAFVKLGLERFHSVAILGFNAPEWFISNFAAIFAGGVSLGIYLTNSSAACGYILKNSEANIAIVENEMQLKKILDVRHELPHLKAIIQYIGEPSSPDVLSWKEVLEIGQTLPDEVLERRIKSLAINQCCTLIYTSGTTGNPKGVMLTHDNLYYTSSYIAENWEVIEHIKYVSFLPLSHIAAQIADIYTGMAKSAHTFFAQPDALKGGLVETLKEVKPTAFFAVPRVYEKISEKIMESVNEMSFVKKNLIHWALKCGQSYTKSCLERQPDTPYGYTLAERFLQKIRQAVGLQHCELFFSGGAQLSKDTQEFYLSLNIVALECYGMSECSGPHLMNTKKNYCLGSVGKNTLYTETQLQHCNFEGHGEICLRGRHVFMGYLGEEQKTLEAFDHDGWLHSGDIGCYNQDGFLFVTGRIKELIITAGGENVAPLPIEDAVKHHLPIVSHAVLIGDKRKFLSMLLTLKTEIDTETLIPTNRLTTNSCAWCASVGSDAKTIEDIVQKYDRKVMMSIQEGIDRVNKNALSNAQRIQKWTILPMDFSIPGGELGPSLKLKRSVVVEKYQNIINEFYKS